MSANGPQPRTRRSFLKSAAISAAVVAGARTSPKARAADRPAAEPRPRPCPVTLGLASYTFRDFTLDQCLAMTLRVGLKHICLKDFHLPMKATPDQLAAAAAKAKKFGLDLYGGGVIAMGNEAQVKQAFEYAKGAGMRTIVGTPSPAMLPLVSQKVQQYDIRVAIHNHGPGDKTYPTPESVYERIKDLDKRIGLCMDVGHTVRIGADPVRDAERFADRLLDVHMKDVSAASPAGQCVEAGRGVIDIPSFLHTLLKVRYSGIVSFEYEKDSKDPLPGLAESVGYVRGVLAAG
jgi:inosose dehydratase